MKRLIMVNMLLLALFVSSSIAQDQATLDTTMSAVETIALPSPPVNLKASDIGNDHGHAIKVEWDLSADDGSGTKSVLKYEIYRWVPFAEGELEDVRNKLKKITSDLLEENGDEDQLETQELELEKQFESLLDQLPQAYAGYPQNGEFKLLGKVASGVSFYNNTGEKEEMSSNYLADYVDLYYRVDAVTIDSTIRSSSAIAGPVQSSGQWFNTGRIPVLFAVIVFGFLTIFLVSHARKGADLYVRPLGGIEAVDDAIGRATEMGRPILYVLGLGTAADIATIASFTVLGRVAKRVAEYQTKLLVPTYDPIVMSVAQEVVKSAYFDAGRPDDYDQDTVHFVTQSQFAYVAAVNGIMLRELPATNIYMGKFFAESLILAETGAVAGSIQISGTDEIAQIPFFIVACDYTLIGEELYAASAYLGREPILLGSLKAQDYAKAALIVFAIAGIVSANFGWDVFVDLFKVAN